MTREPMLCPRCRGKMYTRNDPDLSERVELLEHWSNQANILLTTLGDIMEELKNQER